VVASKVERETRGETLPDAVQDSPPATVSVL